MSKIRGETLLGFGDFFQGGYRIGATAPKKLPPKAKAKPTAQRAYPKAKPNNTVQQHGKVLSKAHQVIAKAVSVIKQGAQHLKAPPKKAVHVGAAAASAMSPKQKLAVQKSNAAADKANKLAKPLAAHLVKTKASAQALAKRMVAQKKLAQLMRKKGKRGKTAVGAMLADPVIGQYVEEALGEYYDVVGADPDPSNPGFLTDGTLDPAFASTDPSIDPGALTDTPMDSGANLPPPPPMDTFIRDMASVGGIAYDGSKGTPEGYVLSYGLATRKTDHSVEPDTAQIDGTEHFGYVWGLYDKVNPANGGIPWGSGDNLKASTWNHIHGRFWLGRGDWNNPVDASEAFGSASKTNKYGTQYGPLVGNPALPDFARMRVDAQGNMFWMPQEAPDWLTFPLKQAAALTAQAAAKAAADAAAADAAAQAKAAADAAAAQAAQDAANALAESQARSDANVAQMQSESQAQQALVQQQQADTQAQQLETQQAQQAGDILVRKAQRMEEYYAQHPEEEFAVDPNEPPMPGMEDGNGGEGEYDDGAPVPGGDIMLDADGEGYVDDEGSDE